MKLGKLIHIYRFSKDIGIRDMAKKIGISGSTLSRIENGKQVTSTTFYKLLKWMMEK